MNSTMAPPRLGFPQACRAESDLDGYDYRHLSAQRKRRTDRKRNRKKENDWGRDKKEL